ncbi:MAG: hemolysin family protein [Clostridium sp.]|nr:hemolysin family protein [Clostridium sp.]
MSSYTTEIVLLIVLLGLSGFFSMSETALMAITKIRMRTMLDEGVKGAKLLDKLLQNPSKLLSAILIGNNVVNIGASAISTTLTVKLMGGSDVGALVATGVMTVLVLIFGEITPKTIAKMNAEKVALRVSRPINIISIILKPLVFIFTAISSVVIKLFGGDASASDHYITEEELKTIVDVSEEEGVLENTEKEMIFNVFKFGDIQVEDIMIQRVNITALNKDITKEELFDTIKKEQFSRIPVYDETIDNVVGVLNVKDLILLEDKSKEFNVMDYTREPFYTFEFKKVSELFTEMKKTRNHMAVVLDEYGGTVGIVTMEDLVEEIVGDIEDEYDEAKDKNIRKIKENEYIVEGSTRIDELSDLLGFEIESEELDSVGGLIIDSIGRMPKEKEQIEIENVKFIVEKVKKNSIKKVKILI